MKTSLSLRGTDSRHIVYNFYQVTKLTLNLAVVRGTVWEPFADVTYDGGLVDGTSCQIVQGRIHHVHSSAVRWCAAVRAWFRFAAIS